MHDPKINKQKRSAEAFYYPFLKDGPLEGVRVVLISNIFQDYLDYTLIKMISILSNDI